VYYVCAGLYGKAQKAAFLGDLVIPSGYPVEVPSAYHRKKIENKKWCLIFTPCKRLVTGALQKFGTPLAPTLGSLISVKHPSGALPFTLHQVKPSG
jgi:hypothetical protein